MDGLPAQVMTAAEERGPAWPYLTRWMCGSGWMSASRSTSLTSWMMERLFSRPVASDQAAIEAVLDRAAGHGVPGLVTGQPGSIAQLALAVAARRGVPVAYVPGLVMRRAADLYPGEARTGKRDAYVIADTARTRRRQVHWLDAGSDAYAGLAPVTRQSGTSLNAETRSRRGSHRLKNAMFLAAFAALRDPASKTFYDRKRAEGKRHNAALICLARRRCDVTLAILRTRQPYQSARPRPQHAEAA
jgi:hypothetical protein